jgi:hypothetical protein
MYAYMCVPLRRYILEIGRYIFHIPRTDNPSKAFISVFQEFGRGYILTRITKSMSSLGCWKPHYMGSRNSLLWKPR